jgi:uncharacterized membrane protein
MTEPVTSKATLSRGLRIYILISTALNVIFISFLAVAVMHFSDDDDDKYGRRPDLFSHLVRALEGPEKRALFRQMRQHGEPRAQTPAQPRPDIAGLLTADPFDADALRHALSDHKTQLVTKNDVAIKSYVDIIASMSATERAAHARNVQERLDEARQRRQKKSHD